MSSNTNPYCDFIAATNIETLYTEWSCTNNSIPTTDICTWDGLTCDSNSSSVIYICL